jgi:hypothetical protein
MNIKACRGITMLALAWLFVSAISSAQTPVWKGKIVKENGVTIVQSPKEPMYREPILNLKEELTIGGEKSQGEAMFSSAWRIAVDNDGEIYVGDMRKAGIKVFDKNGTFVRTIGRPGQGPGELTLVGSLSVSRDNRDLIVGDMNKLMVFDLQGRFKRSIATRGLIDGADWDGRGNVFVQIFDISGRRSLFRVFGPNMTTVVSDIAVIPDPPKPNMFMPRAYWLLDPRDRLVFGYPNAYEISFFNEQFKVVKMIRREYDPAQVTGKDKKIYLKRSNPPGFSGPPKYPCPLVHAPFRSFFVDDQNRLIVQTWDRSPDGKQDIYDVFDSEGRFSGRFVLNVHPDPINPTPTILKNNKLYTVESDADGYEVVKRYAVTWKIKQ